MSKSQPQRFGIFVEHEQSPLATLIEQPDPTAAVNSPQIAAHLIRPGLNDEPSFVGLSSSQQRWLEWLAVMNSQGEAFALSTVAEPSADFYLPGVRERQTKVK